MLLTRARSSIGVISLTSVLVVLVACNPIASSTTVPSGPAPTPVVRWPRPADALAKVAAAGLTAHPQEHLGIHRHSHLDVFVDGVPVVVPAGIGINIDDPEVKPFDTELGVSYGGIQRCAQPCISPLHTHGPDGFLHTEAQVEVLHTLGEFFDEWGVALTTTCVAELCSPAKPIAIYLDGAAYAGDPREVQLADGREIAIVIGTPPATIPKTVNFGQA